MVARDRPDASLSCANEWPAARAPVSSVPSSRRTSRATSCGQVCSDKFTKASTGLRVNGSRGLRVEVRQANLVRHHCSLIGKRLGPATPSASRGAASSSAAPTTEPHRIVFIFLGRAQIVSRLEERTGVNMHGTPCRQTVGGFHGNWLNLCCGLRRGPGRTVLAIPRNPRPPSHRRSMWRHHLLKTFYDRPTNCRDRQLPDSTVIWASPSGHT